jgi:TRAP-type C4-dicarboxylate transport system substrate-binding protein
MNFGELYTALSQKTVDAMECPINLIYTSKFYEVQKYLSLTGHIYAIAPLIVNEEFFQSLPPDLQQLLIDAGKTYADRERFMTVSEEDDMMDKLREYGMEINDLTEEEKNEFKKLCAPIYAEFEDRVGKALLDKVIAANQ